MHWNERLCKYISIYVDIGRPSLFCFILHTYIVDTEEDRPNPSPSIPTYLHLHTQIASEILRTSLPNKLNKKLEGFRTNQKKLETINYELALTSKGKGRVAGSDAVKDEMPTGGGGAGGEKEE